MDSTAQQAIDPKLPTGPPLKTALKIVSRSTETRASNAARAALVVANVTPTGYRVGLFMAGHARYAQPEDIRRNVVPGELFSYWPQAKIAAELGCSERQVRRGVRSMREAGALEVRRRVRPCEASYVWVLPVRSDGAGVRSGVLSGVRSHTEPRTEPQKNHVGSSRAREEETRWYCSCGNDWPKRCGSTCYPCGKDADAKPPKPADEPKACTCGTAFRNSHERLCLDCKGKPSAAQIDAVRGKGGCRGEDDRVGEDGGGGDNPSVPETETRQPPETRGQSQDKFVPQEDEIPPDGCEPGPNELRFKADFAQWTVGKRTPTQHGSDRRRMARTARHELADLAEGRTG